MRRSGLAIVIAVVAVSFSSIFIRWSEAEPLAIAFYRQLFTTLMLLPFVAYGARTEVKRLGRRNIWLLLAIGIVLSLHFSMWIISLELTTVASSVILVTAHPILVGTVSHFLLGDRLSRLNFAGIVLGVAGVVVLTWGDFTGGPLTASMAMGDVLAFAAGICAGVYILGGRKMRASISLVTYAFFVYLFSTGFLLLWCVMSSTPLYPLPSREYWLFLIMALVPGILGHTLYNWSLKHVTATVVSVSLLGEPIGSSMLAALLLDEIPGIYVMIGGPIVLAGIFLASMRARTGRRRRGRKGFNTPRHHC